jgi:hypothetical protein
MLLILTSPIGLGGTLGATFVQEVVLIRDLIGFVVREVLLRSVCRLHRLRDTIIRSILDRADVSADFLHPLLDSTQVCWEDS